MSENRDRRANRRRRKRQKTKRLKDISSHKYVGTFWFEWGLDDAGHYVQVGTYPKRQKSSRRQRFYKKHSNRIIRRGETAYQNGDYRKAFDYWWTIY